MVLVQILWLAGFEWFFGVLALVLAHPALALAHLPLALALAHPLHYHLPYLDQLHLIPSFWHFTLHNSYEVTGKCLRKFFKLTCWAPSMVASRPERRAASSQASRPSTHPPWRGRFLMLERKKLCLAKNMF